MWCLTIILVTVLSHHLMYKFIKKNLSVIRNMILPCFSTRHKPFCFFHRISSVAALQGVFVVILYKCSAICIVTEIMLHSTSLSIHINCFVAHLKCWTFELWFQYITSPTAHSVPTAPFMTRQLPIWARRTLICFCRPTAMRRVCSMLRGNYCSVLQTALPIFIHTDTDD